MLFDFVNIVRFNGYNTPADVIAKVGNIVFACRVPNHIFDLFDICRDIEDIGANGACGRQFSGSVTVEHYLAEHIRIDQYAVENVADRAERTVFADKSRADH